ncbi:STAS domain-containing protein [Halobacillus massiliensis]|uniref:STAS domain-containing protein n=1 Tax=Halobacillus massiliensis TaxID=1926286 RepID=UPI0009E3EFCE|nr:STAS domain-containing protein [Halobacillus massiliensis]
MELTYENTMDLKTFIQENKQSFEETLLLEAVNVRDKIEEILYIGNIDLVNNAHELIVYIIDGDELSLKNFAQQEGIAWASHSLTVSFKLEWIQAIRRTLWIFIQEFYEHSEQRNIEDLFEMERKINNGVDDFLNTFFIRYTTYKDKLLKAQQEMVENLSVPIIPINNSICILPLIGSIDSRRAEILNEKVLTEVANLRITTLIMDLSGIAEMEGVVISDLMKVIEGTSLMGCKTVITGMRKEIVTEIIKSDIPFNQHTETLATLQQALTEYFKE